jgi:PAT family beta-lactamase induction signal transducer AmpG
VVWLVDQTTKWSASVPGFWLYGTGGALVLAGLVALTGRAAAPDHPPGAARAARDDALARGPMFGALLELLRRPAIVPVLAFILIFKLPDAAMGFMVKPFWVDAGFTAGEIGLVSVNIGLVLSIAGGVAGGWITDRIGIFNALWILGLAQAFSNLGYWVAAGILPLAGAGTVIPFEHKLVLYAASATESFTGGLGTAAFLAFLMAIVRKDHAATEYALLSSVFALSRSVAGWVGGLGAQSMGYGNWFLLTFFLAFPAYLLLPWVRRMLQRAVATTPARDAGGS